jgi:heme exporter protein D
MQNTNTAGSPATPDLSASVNASQLANPATVVGEMAGGSDFAPETTNDGSHDWGQWIAIGIISLTIVSLVMNIVVNRRSLVKLNQDDAMQKERITKLEAKVELLENPQPVRRAA